MPKPKCYFDVIDICKELLLLSEEKYFTVIRKEITDLEQKEKSAININLFRNRMLDVKFKELPQTYELFRTIPNLRSVQLLTLAASHETIKQKGDPSEVNDTLCAILPVRVAISKKNKLYVDGESKFLKEGTWIMYDASHEHSFSNKHKRLDTIYLLVSIDRPDSIPKGIA